MNETLRLVIWARGLRDFGDGFVAVLLPLYLVRLGFSPFEIGVLAGTALLGSALLTLVIGLIGNRYDARDLLIIAATLAAATGVALSIVDSYALLLVVAFIGSVNPSGGSASAFVPIEHAVLTRQTAAAARTSAFARYSLVGGLAAAGGALAASLPEILTRMGWPELLGVKVMFAVYAMLGLVGGLLYVRMIPMPPSSQSSHSSSLGPSRAIVYKLAALFSLDAFAGGFVIQSLLALWLFERFDLSLAAAGLFFFWSGILSAFSYPVAAWLSRRFGLVNTMVFTHIPSSLCLILAALAPSLPLALSLLLVRAGLSQMDVPTRSSYVMAVVTEPERTAAASLTSIPRNLAASLSPALAGALFSLSWAASPLIICGALKVAYDILLLNQFRRLKPPEEC
ncbi:MFS transporter [Methylocystis sp. B8]|uniref:MFS transporter n=1 Tax=Methylocystis sp. B8 TaxID=544938 RepID=UPI0010FF3B07|nr:MFS transporter [Methylocystis sp. B8]TLG71897.1 MFS transporter [Methylocystis sp. B8]